MYLELDYWFREIFHNSSISSWLYSRHDIPTIPSFPWLLAIRPNKIGCDNPILLVIFPSYNRDILFCICIYVWYIMLCHVIYVILSYVILSYLMLCYATQHNATQHKATQCNATHYTVMYIIQCNIMYVCICTYHSRKIIGDKFLTYPHISFVMIIP